MTSGHLHLRARERLRFFFFVTLNGLVSMGLTIGLSVSEGLFLSYDGLGPAMLPPVFIATAVATALTTFVYAAYVDKMRNDRYFQVLQGCAIAALLVLLVGVGRGSAWAVMGLYGFYYVAQGIFNTHFWNYATDYFDTLEAKRLFPFFPLGNSVGGFLGGLTASLLGGRMGATGLISVWVALLTTAILLIQIVSPRLRGWVVTEAEEADEASLSNIRHGVRFLSRSPLGRWHVAYALLMITSLFFLQFLYSGILSRAYPNADQLTAFIGRFLAVTNIVEIVLEIGFTPRLIGWGGVGASNMFYPLSTGLGFALMGALANVPAAVYSRMNRETFENAVSGSCRNLLFNAYPLRFRGRIRAFIEGAVTNTGIVLAGGALMLLGRLCPPDRLVLVVTWLGGLSSLAFLGVALAIRREYLAALVRGLKDYRLDLDDVNLELEKVHDDELLRMLPVLETDADEANLAIVRRVLQVLASRDALDVVMARLDHVNARVRLVALDVLFADEAMCARTWRREGVASTLRRVLENREVDGEVRARALEALATQDALEPTASWLDDPAAEVRAAAAALQVQRTDKAAVTEAWRVLEKMLDDASPSVRRAMIRRLPAHVSQASEYVLAYVHDDDDGVRRAVLETLQRLDVKAPEMRRRVQPLLDDRDDDVRSAVVRFLGGADDASLLPVLATRLSDDAVDVRRAALETLQPLGMRVLPHVQPLLESRSTPTVETVLRLLSRLPDPESRQALRDFIHSRIEQAHDAVIADCLLSTEAPTSPDAPDATEATDMLQTPAAPLALALRDFVNRALTHAMKGLEGLEDPTIIRNIRRCLEMRHRQARGDAMEALSNLRERSIANGLLLLLDEGTPPERLSASVAWRHLDTPPARSDVFARLHQHPDRWIRAASRMLDDQSAPAAEGGNGRETEDLHAMKHLLFLKKVSLFSQMSLEQLEIVSRIANEQNLYAGEVIFREDQIGDMLYVIVSGRVRVVKGHRTSHEVTLVTLGEADYFGEMAVLDNEPRSATVVVEDDATLLSISGEQLRDIIRQKPEIAFEIFKVLSSRLRRADRAVSDLTNENLRLRQPQATSA